MVGSFDGLYVTPCGVNVAGAAGTEAIGEGREVGVMWMIVAASAEGTRERREAGMWMDLAGRAGEGEGHCGSSTSKSLSQLSGVAELNRASLTSELSMDSPSSMEMSRSDILGGIGDEHATSRGNDSVTSIVERNEVVVRERN